MNKDAATTTTKTVITATSFIQETGEKSLEREQTKTHHENTKLIAKSQTQTHTATRCWDNLFSLV